MHNVAVIGAGPSGLTSLKNLRDYDLSAELFESSSEIAGIWSPNRGPTWSGMRTNLSKNSCEFSEHSHPRATSEFPSVKEMQEYLESYLGRFDLEGCLRLKSRVTRVVPKLNGVEVFVCDAKGREQVRQFDKVVIASGFFSIGKMRELPNRTVFEGSVLHGSQYRNKENFVDKDVVVEGNGLSGVEIAADLVGAARTVTHIIRGPSIIIPRQLQVRSLGRKIPLDLVFYRRSRIPNTSSYSEYEKNQQRNAYLMQFSDQNQSAPNELYIRPGDGAFYPVAISDHYLEFVRQGKIKVIRANGVKSFEERGVILDDQDHSRIKADAIISATGYKFTLPFLSDQVKAKLAYREHDQLQPTILYRGCFSKDEPRLGFVGCYKGPFFGIMELQARLVAKAFAEGSDFIDDDQYRGELENEAKIREQKPRPQFPHPDYVEFADAIAQDVGCFPSLENDDPRVNEVYERPVIPAHYRLAGAHSNRRHAEEAMDSLSANYFGK